MNLFNKLKFFMEKEKSFLCFIMLILGVTLIFNTFTETITMIKKINFYIYFDRLFLFNQMFCLLLFGIFLILLSFFSIKRSKSSKMIKIHELVYCTIGVVIFIISLIPLPDIIESSINIQPYLPIFVSFVFIGFSIAACNIYLLGFKSQAYS